MVDQWGADTPVSMPEPLPESVVARVNMFGYVFTDSGLFFDLNRADYEEISTPTFRPAVDPTEQVVYGDTDA